MTVLSHRLWCDVFQSDPNVVGSTGTVEGAVGTIIGVAAPHFDMPPGTGAWTKFAAAGEAAEVLQMDGYARVSPGASAAELRAQLDALARALPPWQDGRRCS